MLPVPGGGVLPLKPKSTWQNTVEAEGDRRAQLQMEKYRECNKRAARAIALQQGDPLSLAVAARGLCSSVENELRKVLRDVYADYPEVSTSGIEKVRQLSLEQNAAEIVAVRAMNGNGNRPQPEKPSTVREY